jgi:drug/metabolite transporter (DMT)-like permease
MPVILAISWNQLSSLDWESFSSYAWVGLIYVVVGATFLTYALNAYAIKLLTPVIAAMYLYAQPFITTILSVLFGKDTLTLTKFLAGLLILTGLYFAAIRRKRQKKQTNI